MISLREARELYAPVRAFGGFQIFVNLSTGEWLAWAEDAEDDAEPVLKSLTLTDLHGIIEEKVKREAVIRKRGKGEPIYLFANGTLQEVLFRGANKRTEHLLLTEGGQKVQRRLSWRESLVRKDKVTPEMLEISSQIAELKGQVRELDEQIRIRTRVLEDKLEDIAWKKASYGAIDEDEVYKYLRGENEDDES